jgi:cytochrome c oxidase subunit IV
MSEHASFQPRVYVIVYVILVALTLTTIGLTFVPMGQSLLPAGFVLSWHTLDGLAIAAVKGSLVTLFFMEALRASRLTVMIILCALFWLGVLFALTLSDYLTRPWLAY